MDEVPFGEVLCLIAAANAARGWSDGGAPISPPDESDAAQRLDLLFGACGRLAVYGTLAPGRRNHHVVAPLGGEWTEGIVEGDRFEEGWGAALGAPALRPRAGGPMVAVHVLTSPQLPAAWPELDRFEGREYVRILVPVFRAGPVDPQTFCAVANIYAAAPGGPRRAPAVG